MVEAVEVGIYRPFSGTEGADFTSKWCAHCKGDINEDCPILAATYCYAHGHPDYPKEWHYERGDPVCSAFEAIDPSYQPFMKSAAVADLFPGSYRRPSRGEQIRLLVKGSMA